MLIGQTKQKEKEQVTSTERRKPEMIQGKQGRESNIEKRTDEMDDR